MTQPWRFRLTSLCVMAGVAVSVIYLPQSVLTDVAADLGVSSRAASLVATAVQLGYAVGIVLLVPLADRVHPRRQVTVQAALLATALVLSAAMPTLGAVVVGFFVVGLVANIAQVLIPAASRMAPDGAAGATTSALLGALLIGIFGGRVVASQAVEAIGWRAVTIAFAALLLAVLPLARRALDVDVTLTSRSKPYRHLVVGPFRLLRSSPPLAQSAGTQLFVFATFNSLWTVMVVHLTSADVGWSVSQAGWFGVVGLVAGLATPVVGRYVDRVGPLRVAGVVLAVLLVATASVVLDADAVGPLAVSMFLVSWANQAVQSATQSRGLAAHREDAAQANTIYMASVFVGGSAGAYLGPLALDHGGMAAAAGQGVFLVLAAFACWGWSVASERHEHGVRHAESVPPHMSQHGSQHENPTR